MNTQYAWQVLVKLFALMEARDIKWDQQIKVIDLVALFKQAMIEV